MSTAYTWEIVNLHRELSDGYVYKVDYIVHAVNDDYSTNISTSLHLERPKSELIPYDLLTPELVINWVKENLGASKVADVENKLQILLDEQFMPSKAAGIPW